MGSGAGASGGGAGALYAKVGRPHRGQAADSDVDDERRHHHHAHAVAARCGRPSRPMPPLAGPRRPAAPPLQPHRGGPDVHGASCSARRRLRRPPDRGAACTPVWRARRGRRRPMPVGGGGGKAAARRQLERVDRGRAQSPMYISAVEIFETFGVGSVTSSLWSLAADGRGGDDESGGGGSKWDVVWKGDPQTTTLAYESRLWRPPSPSAATRRASCASSSTRRRRRAAAPPPTRGRRRRSTPCAPSHARAG